MIIIVYASLQRHSTEASQIFHDTAGWKSLETWMKYVGFALIITT